jgi:hypothetical protein
MKSYLSVIGLISVLALAGSATAEVLWDQSGLDPNQNGIANSISPGFGGFVIYAVGDVTVDGSGWHVDSITQYYSSWNFDWLAAIANGSLHVFPKTGPLPVGDPATSATVTMTAASNNPDVIEVTASGLSLDLSPGDYWIGITPSAPAGIFGANLQFASDTLVGDPVAVYDTMFPGWGNAYGALDGAMLIEGTRPTPVEDTSWSQVKSLYR